LSLHFRIHKIDHYVIMFIKTRYAKNTRNPPDKQNVLIEKKLNYKIRIIFFIFNFKKQSASLKKNVI